MGAQNGSLAIKFCTNLYALWCCFGPHLARSSQAYNVAQGPRMLIRHWLAYTLFVWDDQCGAEFFTLARDANRTRNCSSMAFLTDCDITDFCPRLHQPSFTCLSRHAGTSIWKYFPSRQRSKPMNWPTYGGLFNRGWAKSHSTYHQSCYFLSKHYYLKTNGQSSGTGRNTLATNWVGTCYRQLQADVANLRREWRSRCGTETTARLRSNLRLV